MVKKSAKDKELKMRLDIVLDILQTKVEEADAAREASDIKAHNHKILQLIAQKQDESLQGKSIAELEAMLR